MSKKSNASNATYVTRIDVALSTKMLSDLKEQGFAITRPQYTIFSARKRGVSCTLYDSGKLVVQGKDKEEFIEFYLEPHVLGSFSYTNQELMVDQKARIGIDEAGKGDFFGPLCVAGVFADAEGISGLLKIGVGDSKNFSDKRILEMAKQIRHHYVHSIVKINPLKYNELYAKFGNLNHLLAWGHATAIENLVNETGCQSVILDQFASERVVLQALERKNLDLDVTQRTKGEEDPVVAAASILAREAFVVGISQLEEKYGVNIPKGASKQVIEAGKLFVRKYGKDALGEVGKLHFKTLDDIFSNR